MHCGIFQATVAPLLHVFAYEKPERHVRSYRHGAQWRKTNDCLTASRRNKQDIQVSVLEKGTTSFWDMTPCSTLKVK
jgi:hypothetical protein